jgi:hypothetical protein
MKKQEVDLSKMRPYTRYDWTDLEVGQGYPTPQGGTYSRIAREYCLRRGHDRTFRTVTKDGEQLTVRKS